MATSTEPAFAKQYERDGYAIVEQLISHDSLAALQQRIAAIAEGGVPEFPQTDVEFEPGSQQSDAVRRIRKINRCAENDDVFLKHISDPAILDYVESVIGPDIKLFGSQCFMKPPGGIEKPFHQDSAYFTIEPLELVTCWIALDDVTQENGCMWVIPESHCGELLDHSQPWDVGGRPDMQVPDELIDRSREVAITLPAGGGSFHHSKLLHRSGPNHSNRPRRGLAVHYMSAQSRWTHPSMPAPKYQLLRGREYPNCV